MDTHFAEVLVYAGNWVTIGPEGVLSVGRTIEEAEEETSSEFGETPLLIRVPTEQELKSHEPLGVYTQRAAVYPPMRFKYPALTVGEKALKAVASEKSVSTLETVEKIGSFVVILVGIASEKNHRSHWCFRSRGSSFS